MHKDVSPLFNMIIFVNYYFSSLFFIRYIFFSGFLIDDFKPASVDTTRPAELVVGEKDGITVTVPHVQVIMQCKLISSSNRKRNTTYVMDQRIYLVVHVVVLVM